MKSAFSMVELVFVIVVLGILAAVAIPKLGATRTDAQISKARSDVASIRSSILTERQARIIVGCPAFIPNGTGTYTCNGTTYNQMDNGGLFGGVLMYPISNVASADGQWSATAGSGTYTFKIAGSNCNFTYTASTGKFELSLSQPPICNSLID